MEVDDGGESTIEKYVRRSIIWPEDTEFLCVPEMTW